MTPRPSGGSLDLRSLIEELSAVRRYVAEQRASVSDDVPEPHPAFRESQRNLLSYLALRNFDLRDLQMRLASLGVSSLGRAEAHVLESLDAVLIALRSLAGEAGLHPNAIDFSPSESLLRAHKRALLGMSPGGRHVRIMVTLPAHAATDYGFVRDLAAAGMDSARINCAYDGPEVWERMIFNVRRAAIELGREIRVMMDLAGPKLRTGPLLPGPRVVRIRPQRDERGHVLRPALIWLSRSGVLPLDEKRKYTPVPVDGAWLAGVVVGETIAFRDARDRKRRLRVVLAEAGGCWATLEKTAYIETGTVLTRKEPDASTELETTVGELPAMEIPIVLHAGDFLLLEKGQQPGRPARRDRSGRVRYHARISCSLPEVFECLRQGDVVRFDDGKIEGVVQTVRQDRATVKITRAGPYGSKLRADKGINLPETPLRLRGLTEKDRRDLDFVVEHADLIGASFVNEAAELRQLQRELEGRGASHVGVLVKIETRRAFQALPELLLTLMGSYPVGIMIARGDLAVECGWERMAEVQEEILWFCEAAHMPVVWATQVLENLAKRGLASRAEITDAAMAVRAECVMLNKGPFIRGAIKSLDDILRRMQDHQTKKFAKLRRLKVSQIFADS